MFDRVIKAKLYLGIVLILLGIVLPGILSSEIFLIYNNLHLAAVNNDSSSLIIAAISLALLNSIRGFPHYLGAFLVAESFEQKDNVLFKPLAVLVLIPSTYAMIALAHDVVYDFGVPALAVLCIILLLGGNEYNYVSDIKKAMLIMVFLTAFQFLDIIPLLSPFPVGRGDLSMEVKLISDFLQADFTLNFLGFLFFGMLLLMGTLQFMLIKGEINLRRLSEVKEKANIEALESRKNMEMQTLVHDLKSPLTAAQMLVGAVKHSCVTNNLINESKHLTTVEDLIERISRMISEILYDDYKEYVSVYSILKGILAQVSARDYAKDLMVQIGNEEEKIYANRIKMIRAIINLLENSYAAADKRPLKLQIIVDSTESEVSFTVSDNGIGIKSEDMGSIFDAGFSTKNSHGLGLNFVKHVAESCGGNVQVNSKYKVGTSITIYIPKE